MSTRTPGNTRQLHGLALVLPCFHAYQWQSERRAGRITGVGGNTADNFASASNLHWQNFVMVTPNGPSQVYPRP